MNLRAQRQHAFVLILVITTLVLVHGAAADIMIDNPEPHIGDLVHIRLLPALQTQTMVIITPNTTYRFIGGIPESAAFIPQATGQHIIQIIDDNTLVDTATFTVVDAAATPAPAAAKHLTVSATTIKTGEPLLIDAPVQDVQKVRVKTGSREMFYIDSTRPITYIPAEEGMLEISLIYTNGSSENMTVVVQGAPDPFTTPPIDAEQNFTVDNGQPAMVSTSGNKTVNAALIWEQQGRVVRQTTASIFEMQTLEPGTYDLEVRVPGKSLRKVRFSNLQYDRQAIGIEEVEPGEINGNALASAVDAFAIDPTALNFTSATITFIATGNAIYKCVDYDFSTKTCAGENRKLQDLIPGRQYSITIDARDPLFTQTGYLVNPNFENGTFKWVTLDEGANAGTYSAGGFDAPQNNTADISASGKNQAVISSYYQQFNLTIPAGTNITGVNFSFMWRVSLFSANGVVNFTVQNSARTATYCGFTTPFTGTTLWAQQNVTAPTDCPLGNFSPNTNYTVRLKCNLATTAAASSQEACKWDNISVIVTYNDTTTPLLFNYFDAPDPVNFSDRINITVNVTDNIAVSAVLVEIGGTNRTMLKGPANTYYYDAFNTMTSPGVYLYKLWANDSSNNTLTNASSLLNFTVQDVIAPFINISAPPALQYTNASSFTAFFNLSDQVGVSNCSLNVSGTLANSTMNPVLGQLTLTSALVGDGVYLWNITCNDTSGNRNTTTLRTIVRDSIPPAVFLNLTNGSILGNTSFLLNYTARDATLANCSLWHNFNGSWALNATERAPNNYTISFFSQNASEGTYLWTVECNDSAGNDAFNRSNYTLTVDTTPPRWTNVQTAPATGATYDLGAAYQFNITWIDNVAVNSTQLETNVTGALANVTPTRIGNVYTYTFTDLPAGRYVYRWYANDSAVWPNNQNVTAQLTFDIVKATPALNLSLNGTDDDMTVSLGDSLNLTGNVTTPKGSYLELYVDGARMANGAAPLANITFFTLQKKYNVTLVYNQTTNFSFSSVTHFVTVKDIIPPGVVLGNPANGSITGDTVRFFFTPYDNIDITNCTVVIDGTRTISNVSTIDVLNNITVTGISEGAHNWTVNCSDSSNNTAINGTPKNFTVDTTPPASFLPSQPASGNISSNLSPTFSWAQSSDLNFANYTIQVDNDINFGSINYARNFTGVTNTSAVFTLLDQFLWYWRVIAVDLALNERVAAVSNYTTDATPPFITINAPASGSYANATRVNLTYTPNDFTDIANCSLYINGTLNQTNTTVNNTNINWFITYLGQGTYNWSVACYDIAYNKNTSANVTLTVDVLPPLVFTLLGPTDGLLTDNNTQTYTWTQTTDPNFANYTVQVTDTADFSWINYTFKNSPITNITTLQTPGVADGTWFWRVIAYDLAGNAQIMHPNYTVDTTPPTAFDLLTPNDTEQRNDMPLLIWQQSNDTNFKNYTLLISDKADFSSIIASNSTNASNMTNATLGVPQNVTLYWRVIAYDLVNHSTNSTHDFVYIADFSLPNVTLGTPANLSVINSTLVTFTFNVTDVGNIANCTLYVDDSPAGILNMPTKNITLTAYANLDAGDHWWNVSCTDLAGNKGYSVVRNFTVNVTIPTQLLFENSPGSFASATIINLTTNDSAENSVSFSIAGNALANVINATQTINGTGMFMKNNTKVNFSGVFSQNNANTFFVTWKLLKVNTTGSTEICRFGDDNTGGAAIGTVTKKTLAGNCTNAMGDINFAPGDNVTLVIDLFSTAGTARTFTHFWDTTDASWVQFAAYKLGYLNASFVDYSDPRVPESGTYVEQCNVTCFDGSCLSTSVYLQIWNGTSWLNVSTTGNLTLNGTQLNPMNIGEVNASTLVNFTLFGANYSRNNTLSCYAISTTSSNLSAAKNVSVNDTIIPQILLNGPANGVAFSPQQVTFSYTPYDRHITTCSLWGNFSGTWQVNQTHAGVVNATPDSFSPVLLDYGYYVWNVECSDLQGNSNFNITNFTINVAGDVEIKSANITFSTGTPVEGQQITIFANITNRGNKTEQNVTVQFWDGNPASGTQIGTDRNVTLGRLSSNTTNMTWTLPLGLHQVYVVLDPYNTIVESDETNNIANTTIFIPLWQVYYGNVSGNVTLGNAENSTFLQWLLANKTGNIYISDTDTANGIQFLSLQAIGRNTSGQNNTNTNNDFEDIDSLLSTSSLTDSVNATYTSGGFPRQLAGISVFGRTIANVSISRSSSDLNFTTGLLWDADDSANAFYDTSDKEDLIFITRITNNTLSANGYVDYEIKVPSKLKGYRGTTNTVDFYYELQ